MSVTYMTIAWAILAMFSILGFYFFNKGRSLFAFITSRKYLILFLLASVLGMRQVYIPAFLLFLAALFWMYMNYAPYIEKCRRLNNMREFKQ